MYYLWSTRSSGWMYANGAYGSDRTQAQQLTLEDAVTLCKKHISYEGEFGLLPVRTGLLEEILRG